MLELKDISFNRDNKQILDKINLKLEDGKFYVITGPNGSGKSTLAKIIMGIKSPDSGKILLDGKDITNMSIDERAKLGIGFAFQQPVHFKGITVYDLLKIASGNKNLFRKEACDILAKVGLCAMEYCDREINNSLSGGELKRIELASVMVRNPKCAIFDEPEAGIDLWSFRNLTDVFKRLHGTAHGITLVISHQERILDIADQIILMEAGHVKKAGNKNIMVDAIMRKTNCPKGAKYE